MAQSQHSVKDFMVGMIGGAVGVLAMDLFSQYVSPHLVDEEEGGPSAQNPPATSIALAGQHHRQDESSTAALGRMLYHTVEGHDPDKQTKSELSNLVHWSYGVLQGGVYGFTRPAVADGDVLGGALFGTGLWLIGDEVVVPMLGLQDGPAASPPATHFNRLAMHLAYGVTTAVTTQFLKRVI